MRQKIEFEFPFKKVLNMIYFQVLHNTFACSYLCKDLHYCEKTNKKSGQTLCELLNLCFQKSFKKYDLRPISTLFYLTVHHPIPI